MMDAGRWELVKRLFEAALGRPATDRAAFIESACGADVELRREVESLLAAHAEAGSFAEQPPIPPASAAGDHVVGPSGDRAQFHAGHRVGAYEIRGFLGAGAMGDVYRAHDLQLRRDVALKILPASFAADADRVARFEREARMLAALNHPQIAAIYGLEQTPGTRALVLELAEGETLAERMQRGPVPMDEALSLARQIAEALEAAHEKGIIHRDLKPANIKVTSDGTVKVLDFGLAKAFVGEGVAIDLAVPTITREGSRGVIVGTPAYMSPEQARGQAVDKRTDIWAFGCVLFEMLTARPAFPGETISDTIAAVLDREPDWLALPAATPTVIRTLLRRCLAKERKDRLPDIAVARMETVEARTAPEPSITAQPVQVPPVRFWQRPPVPLATGILAVAVATGFAVWTWTLGAPGPPPRVVRFTVTPSGTAALVTGGGQPPALAISPDATRLAYRGLDGMQIFVRAFDELEPTALLEPTSLKGASSGADSLFFSPDGQWIGFFDGGTLKKVAVTGGQPVTVAPISGLGTGASWNSDDTIIFATSDPTSGLLRAAPTGSEPEVLTTPSRGQAEQDHWWPEVLPGGQAVLFTITSGAAPENWQIALLDLTSREQRILVRGGHHARYVRSGHLVYGVAGTMRAVAFDLNRLEVIGAPVPVLGRVATSGNGGTQMSISRDGTLVYVPGGLPPAPETLVWIDRQGREEPLKAPQQNYTYARVSPDGTRVALDVGGGIVGRDIWIWDLARETLTRLTFDPQPDTHPVWTPDGQRLVFSSMRKGPRNLFWQAADGSGTVERLTESPNEQFATAFSPDGKRLLFREETATTGADVMVLAVDGGQPSPSVPVLGRPGAGSTRTARPLVQTTFNELNGEISPDGRWVAYDSNESGRNEVYVRPVPDVDTGRWQVSTGGGAWPLWARNGKELFYVGPSGAVMGVAIDRGSTFRVGNPTRLFEGGATAPGRAYDVSLDGQRFLVIKEGRRPDDGTAIVVQNWGEELQRLVPTK